MLDIALLSQKCDIGAVLTKLNISYERRSNKNGYELYFSCPTGNHKTDPHKLRCSIAAEGSYKGLFNCWACDFHGNIIHLIRFVTGWDFKRAIEFLQNDYGRADLVGIDALNYRLRTNKGTIAIDPPLPVFDLPEDYKLVTSCNNTAAKLAMEWLQVERHITREYMERFDIGFSEHKQLGPTIIIPVKFKGKVHSIFTAQPFKGGLKRYPKNSPQGNILFNYDRCIGVRKYVMMESILDVIKYECVTGDYAMACFTNMISSRQLKLLTAFDEHGVMPDLDGERGWDLVTRMLPVTGKGLWLYFPPVGKDPGDCTPNELLLATANRTRYCDYESSQWLTHKQKATHKITSIIKK